MTSLPLLLSPITPHPHRCCCCYPLRDTMLQSEHPLSGSRPSGTEYDCAPLSYLVMHALVRLSYSMFHFFFGRRIFPRCPLPRFQRPLYSFLVQCYAQLATVHAVANCLPVKIRYFVKTVQRIVEILSPVDNHIFYTVSQRKEATKLLAITFLNLNRFSKFFHCWIEDEYLQQNCAIFSTIP